MTSTGVSSDASYGASRGKDISCTGKHKWDWEFLAQDYVCLDCGLIKGEGPDLVHEWYDWGPCRKHDWYEGSDYLDKKRDVLSGMCQYDNAHIKLRQLPGLIREIWQLIKDCTTWKQVKRQMTKNKLCEYISDIPYLWNDPVYINKTIMDIASYVICHLHVQVKFEFLIAKCLKAWDMKYDNVPLVWSPLTLKKYEKAWREFLEVDDKLGEEFRVEKQFREPFNQARLDFSKCPV